MLSLNENGSLLLPLCVQNTEVEPATFCLTCNKNDLHSQKKKLR